MKRQTQKGDLWFDTRDEQFYFNDGTRWINCLSDDLYDPSKHMHENPAWFNALRAFTWSALIIAIGGIGFWALNSTLHDMTVNDCSLGIQAACEELKK